RISKWIADGPNAAETTSLHSFLMGSARNLTPSTGGSPPGAVSASFVGPTPAPPGPLLAPATSTERLERSGTINTVVVEGARPGGGADMATGNKLMTADELWRMPDDGQRHELIAGELHTMPPSGWEHGWIVVRVTLPLAQHVNANKLGVVCGAETGFVLT